MPYAYVRTAYVRTATWSEMWSVIALHVANGAPAPIAFAHYIGPTPSRRPVMSLTLATVADFRVWAQIARADRRFINVDGRPNAVGDIEGWEATLMCEQRLPARSWAYTRWSIA